ncbi:Asp23/Gls24 family envelope stress response protein [Spiractinospora alimapuensis]|uniref:Asp23/Gls24 family envelope stress response protein n=1 Tax=Spiractinospora alimapuensis TaxID=2820884 RepID=UPI001F401213|nr:Asp23/Gls24 family envelope stress response protein [Spiractinospora alimapuensis]QVQ50322.1 Asp23/Gls24 family envelope stress response protein [Spiractinospora alimapuensis]
MSPTTAPERTEQSPVEQTSVEPRARDTPGRTDIADRVIERVVRRAVRERPETHARSAALGGLVDTHYARVNVRREGNAVTLRLEVALTYPVAVGQAAQRVRDHVRDRVTALTGLTVRHVDIQVAELVPSPRVR